LPGFTTVTSFGTGLLSDNTFSNQSENQENSDKYLDKEISRYTIGKSPAHLND
jgi:hypothetical protein